MNKWLIETIKKMSTWEKIIYVADNYELVIEKRVVSHKDRWYKGINPHDIIIDDIINPNIFK